MLNRVVFVAFAPEYLRCPIMVRAFVEGSKKLLLQALLLDPVVHSAHAAGEVLDTMLDLQKEYVPAFC